MLSQYLVGFDEHLAKTSLFSASPLMVFFQAHTYLLITFSTLDFSEIQAQIQLLGQLLDIFTRFKDEFLIPHLKFSILRKC